VSGRWRVLSIRNDAVWRTVGTGLLTAVTAALLLPVSLLTDKPKSRPAGLLAVATLLLEYLLVLFLIWDAADCSAHGAKNSP